MPDEKKEDEKKAEKVAKSKVKHFKVVQLTTYRQRLVYPAGQKPAFMVSVTPDKEGKTIFDGHKCWKECEAPPKRK